MPTADFELTVRKALDADHERLWHALGVVRGRCEEVCHRLAMESGLRLRGIDSRAKAPHAVIRKLEEKGCSPEALYECVADMLGVRVIVYNLSDVIAVRNGLSQAVPASMTIDSCEEIDYPTGYQAVHINGRIDNFGYEIQLRTVVQDAWAVTSRADSYRSGRDAALVDRLFRSQSLVLRGVDDTLQAIREMVPSEESVPEAARVSPTEKLASRAARPPIDHRRLELAKSALLPEDRAILDASLSSRAIDELISSIEGHRAQSEVRSLFRAAGTYSRAYDYVPENRYGCVVRAFKGPFVDATNWLSAGGADLSRPLEEYLQIALAEALHPRASVSIPATWEAIRNFIVEAVSADTLNMTDVVVLAGRLPQETEGKFLASLDHRTMPTVRGQPLEPGIVRGLVAGVPVVRCMEPVLSPAVHVVDLSGLSYIQTNPSPDSPADVQVEVVPIDEDVALDLLAENPSVNETLFVANEKRPGAYAIEEALVRLQLRVHLSVIEAGLIKAQAGYALSAKIA